MSATVEDRLIYIRELVHILTDCAQDALINSGMDDAALEPVCDILDGLTSTVDSETHAAGMLTAETNPLFNGTAYAQSQQLCRREFYSNGAPVYVDDGRYERLNRPGGDSKWPH